MAKCKDCLHYEACLTFSKLINAAMDVELGCEHFIDRTKYVEVVRCKDCKHWWKVNELCVHPKCCEGCVAVVEAPADHYCGYGERREGE